MASERASSSPLKRKDSVSLDPLCFSAPASSDLLFPALLQHLQVASGDDEKPLTRDEVLESTHRWRSAFIVWRKVLDCDVLFLGILLHSGCVWSPKFDYLYPVFHYRIYHMAVALREGSEVDLGHDSGLAHLPSLCLKVLNSMQEDYSFDVFALLLLHFLCIVEVFSLPSSTNTVCTFPYGTGLPLYATSSSVKCSDRQEEVASLSSFSPSTGCSFTTGDEDHEEEVERFHSSEDFFFPACLKTASSVWSAIFSSSIGSASAKRAPKSVCPSSLSRFSLASSSRAAGPAQRNEKKEDKRGHHFFPGGTNQNGSDSGNSSMTAEIGCQWNRDRMNNRKKGEEARQDSSNGSVLPSASWWMTLASDADVMEVQAVAHQLVDEWFRLMDHPYLYGGVKSPGIHYSSNSGGDKGTSVGRTTNQEVRGQKEDDRVSGKRVDETNPHCCSSSSLCNNGYATQLKQRDLWFASAIKFSSYVTSEEGRRALFERNAHLMMILAWQRKGWSSYRTLLQDSVPAIFLCLLEQETCSVESGVISCGTSFTDNQELPRKEGKGEKNEDDKVKTEPLTEGKDEERCWVGMDATVRAKRRPKDETSTGTVEKDHMETVKGGFKVLRFPPLSLLLPFHLFGKGTSIAVPYSSQRSSLFPQEFDERQQDQECRSRDGGRTVVSFDVKKKRASSGTCVETRSAADEKIIIRKGFGRWKRQILSIPHKKTASYPHPYILRKKNECRKWKNAATCVNADDNSSSAGSSRIFSFGSSLSLSSSSAFLSSLLALPANSDMEIEEEKKLQIAAAHHAFHKLWLRQNQIRSHGIVVYHSIPIEERHLFFKRRTEEKKKKFVVPSPCRSPRTLTPSLPLSFLPSVTSKGGATRSEIQESCTSLFLTVEEKRKENYGCKEDVDEVPWKEEDAQEASVGIGIALQRHYSPTRYGSSCFYPGRSEALSPSAIHMQPVVERHQRTGGPYQFRGCKKEVAYVQHSEAKKQSGAMSGDIGSFDTVTVRCSLLTLGMVRVESSHGHGRKRRASSGSFSRGLAADHRALHTSGQQLEVDANWQRKVKGMEMQMEERTDCSASGKEQRRKRRRVSMIRSYGFKKRDFDTHSIPLDEEQEERYKAKEETCSTKKQNVQSGKQSEEVPKEQEIEGEAGLFPHVWLMKCAASSGNTEKKTCSSSFPFSFPSTSSPFSYWLLYGAPSSECCFDDCQDCFSTCTDSLASSSSLLGVHKSYPLKTNARLRDEHSGHSRHFSSCISKATSAVKWFESFYGEKVGDVPFTSDMGVMDEYGWVVQCEVNELKGNSAYERGQISGGDVLEKRNEEKQQQQHALLLDPLFHFLRALFCTARRALSLRGTALPCSSTSSPLSSLSSLISFSWHLFPSPEAERIALVHLSHSFALLTLLLATTSRFLRCSAVEMEEAIDNEGMRFERTSRLGLPAFVQLWFSEIVSFLADTSLLLVSSSSLSAFSTTLSEEVKGLHSQDLSFPVFSNPSPLSTCSFVNEASWRKTFPIFLLLRNVCWALALHPVASESVLVAVGWIARMVQYDVKWMKTIRDEVVCSWTDYRRSSLPLSLGVPDLYSAEPPLSSFSSPPLLHCFIAVINIILGASLQMPGGDGEDQEKEKRKKEDEGERERRGSGYEWLSACMPQGWWILWHKAQSEVVKVLHSFILAAPCSSMEEENKWSPSGASLQKWSTTKRIGPEVDVDEEEEEEAQQRLAVLRKLPQSSSSSAARYDGGVEEEEEMRHAAVIAVKAAAVVPKRRCPSTVVKEGVAAQLSRGESTVSINAKDDSAMMVVRNMSGGREEESEKSKSMLSHHLLFTPHWQRKTSFGIQVSLLPFNDISKERRIAVLDNSSDKSSVRLTSEDDNVCRKNVGSAAFYMFGDAVCHHIERPPSFTIS